MRGQASTTGADIRDAEGLNEQMKEMRGRKVDVMGLRVVKYRVYMILYGASVYP